MAQPQSCPQCDALYDPATGGMCPRCLLGAAKFESPTVGQENQKQPLIAPKPAEIERLFPELEILDLIGQGGMGFVYKAKQKNLGREVAVKLLSPSLMDDPAFEERFSREARAMAMMNHPNIIAIYDFGQRGTYYFLVMELVDGLNLRQLVQNTKLQPVEAMQLIPQLCDALQYAHDRGVVHRDIKPENILLSQDGQIKIADFGLAKLTGSTQNVTLTHTKQVMGTLNYMAPEQRERALEVDHRADIYSLGVVIYELLTGELPLGRFAPPSKKVSVDVRLDEVVLRALEKDPTLRFQHASEFKTGVQTLVAGKAGRSINLQPDSIWTKLGSLAFFAVALFFCIFGVLFIVLSGLNLEVIGENTARIIGFSGMAFGGFLFAMYGMYHAVFHPESEEDKKKSEDNKPPIAKNQQPKSRAEVLIKSFGTLCFIAAGIVFIGSTSLGGDLIPWDKSRFVALSLVGAGVILHVLGGMTTEYLQADQDERKFK